MPLPQPPAQLVISSASYKCGPQFQFPEVTQVPAKGNLHMKHCFVCGPLRAAPNSAPPLRNIPSLSSQCKWCCAVCPWHGACPLPCPGQRCGDGVERPRCFSLVKLVLGTVTGGLVTYFIHQLPAWEVVPGFSMVLLHGDCVQWRSSDIRKLMNVFA